MLQIMTNRDGSLWLPRWRHIFPPEIRLSIMPFEGTHHSLLVYLQHPGDEFDRRFAQVYQPLGGIRVYRHRETLQPIKIIIDGPRAGSKSADINYWRSVTTGLRSVFFDTSPAFLDVIEELLGQPRDDQLDAVARFTEPRAYYQLLFALQQQGTRHLGGHFDAPQETDWWLEYWDSATLGSPVQKQLEGYRRSVDTLARIEEQLEPFHADIGTFVEEWRALIGQGLANTQDLLALKSLRAVA